MAFHLQPQLIPQICNSGGFGPPRDITLSSPWPWLAHSVSGLLHATDAPCSDSLSLRLRPSDLSLATHSNSSAHSPKGTPSGLPSYNAGSACSRAARSEERALHERAGPARRHSPLTACKRTISGSISLPSRGSFHLSLTVLVHYRSPKVFSLGKWAPQFPTGLHVSRGTQAQQRESRGFRVRGCHPLRRAVPGPSTNHSFSPTLRTPCRGLCCGLQPPRCNGCNLSHSVSLGCSPFARHYSGNNLFSSPY